MTTFFNLGRWRRARKAWTCWHCKQPIPRGTIYWEDLNDAPAYHSGTRYHGGCVTRPDSSEYGLVDPATHPDYPHVP